MNIDYKLSQDYRLIATGSARISEGNHMADTIRIEAEPGLVSDYAARLEFLLPKHKRVSGKVMSYDSSYGGYAYSLPSQVTAARGIVYLQLVLSGEKKIIKTPTGSATAIEITGSINASASVAAAKSEEFFVQAAETVNSMTATVADIQSKLTAGYFKGEKGDKGVKGDTFVYSDFTASQLAALKGAKGDKGDSGERGLQGVSGVKGDKGDVGSTPVVDISVNMIEPNGDAWVTKGGTVDNPVFELNIPKAEGAVLTDEPGGASDVAISQAGVDNNYMRRLETVYSMNGTPEEQRGYPNGLPSGSSLPSMNLGKYAFLIVYIKSTYCAGSYVISMREKFDLDYRSSGFAKDYAMVDRYFTSMAIINSARSRFQHHSVVEYEDGIPTSKNKDADYVVYRIDGVVA